MILADLVNNARDASYDMTTGCHMISYARNQNIIDTGTIQNNRTTLCQSALCGTILAYHRTI